MAAYFFTGTTAANSRCLSLWNGSSNVPAPPDWTLPGYDDSAWPATVSVGEAYIGQGIEGVAPWVVPPSPHATMLIRCTFRAPVSPPLRYYMHDWRASSTSNAPLAFSLNGGFNRDRQLIAQNEAEVNFGASNLLTIAIDMSDPVSGWGPGGDGSVGWFAFRYIFYEPDATNTAYSWGTISPGVNDRGVLGVGDALTHVTPTAIDTTAMGADGGAIMKVASNGTTTLFLCASGNVYVCGDNSQGFFANGTTDTAPHLSPDRITALADVADITIGGDSALAVTRYGLISFWGPNAHGSLGTNDTTPRLTPVHLDFEGNTSLVAAPGETYLLAGNMIGAGNNFSAFVTPNTRTLNTCGGNAYGQLGIGTTGADVTTFQSPSILTATAHSISGTFTFTGLSAGQDQLLVHVLSAAGSHLIGSGRGTFGTLGIEGVQFGTGADFVNNHFVQIEVVSTTFPILEARQAGQVAFHLFTSTVAVGRGDGVPHGGIPDGTSNVVYGTTNAHERFLFAFGPLLSTLAYVSGGSQNDYVANNSHAVFAGVGTDSLLYTWGWGGAAQMGRGPTIADCLVPTALNGLSSVLGATVAQATMFAISGPPIILPPLGGSGSRSWATMIG